MDTQSIMQAFERELTVSVGVTLVIWFPLMILISQVSVAIREIALNTRKEDHPLADTQYKALAWVAFSIFVLSWCSLALGLVMIGKGLL